MNNVLIWGDLSLNVLGLLGLIIILIVISLTISIILYYISKMKTKNIVNALKIEPGDKLYVKVHFSYFDNETLLNFKHKLSDWLNIPENDIIIVDSRAAVDISLFKIKD